MTVDTPREESELQRRHVRGNHWIGFWATVLTAVLTLIGTLAGLRFAPSNVATPLVPNAAATTTVTAWRTATATVTVTATPVITTSSPTLVPSEDATDSADSSSGSAAIYLVDIKDKITAHSNWWEAGTNKIKTMPYGHSLALRSDYPNREEWLEYTLDAPYRTFRASIGVDDSVSIDCAVEFAVYGNGKLLKKKTVRYAQVAPLAVDISGYVKLRLGATRVDGDCRLNAVYGDATISP